MRQYECSHLPAHLWVREAEDCKTSRSPSHTGLDMSIIWLIGIKMGCKVCILRRRRSCFQDVETGSNCNHLRSRGGFKKSGRITTTHRYVPRDVTNEDSEPSTVFNVAAVQADVDGSPYANVVWD